MININDVKIEQVLYDDEFPVTVLRINKNKKTVYVEEKGLPINNSERYRTMHITQLSKLPSYRYGG